LDSAAIATMPVIAERLVKTFRSSSSLGLFRNQRATVKALDGVSLRIGLGECFGLLGPNGAGKTTLVKILTTLLLPDSGRAWVNGHDVVVEPEKVLTGIGVMLTGERTLYWKLTGRENLTFFGRIHGVPEEKLRGRIGQVVEEFRLGPFIDRLVETYSSGQRIILSFSKSLVADAPTVFLDEPTISLDPNYAAQIRDAIMRLTKWEGRTVILTTQLMHEADLLCDRIALLSGGTIVATGTPAELKEMVKEERTITMKIAAKAAQSGIIRQAVGVPGASITAAEDGFIQLEVKTMSVDDLLPGLLDRLVANGLQIHRVRVSEATLEDAFKRLTSGGT